MDRKPEGEGALNARGCSVRGGLYPTVNEYASLETKKGAPEGYRTQAGRASYMQNVPALVTMDMDACLIVPKKKRGD